MFRMADLNRVIWPVKIGDAEFRGVFEIFSRKELQAREKRGTQNLASRISAGDGPHTTEELTELMESTHQHEDADEAELLERVKGWYDVEDPDGQPLAFSAERLQALLSTHYGYKAFLLALLQASRAGPQKNSLPGPGGVPEQVQA